MSFAYINICRERGGVAEEHAERKRWIDRERQKIMDSVNGNIKKIARKYTLKKISNLCIYFSPNSYEGPRKS